MYVFPYLCMNLLLIWLDWQTFTDKKVVVYCAPTLLLASLASFPFFHATQIFVSLLSTWFAHCMNLCHLFSFRMCRKAEDFFSPFLVAEPELTLYRVIDMWPYSFPHFTYCTFFPQVSFISVFCLTFNTAVTFMTNDPMYLMHDRCMVRW